MLFTDNLSPEELAILSNIIAIELSKDRTASEISVIASFLSAVGDIMEVIAAQREYLEELEEKASECKNKENNKKEG
ncbi:hypothetical protein [Clostridium isatidis]|uniref:Uncharacterized protein n=1 Tax=Clostridium isatidis TaxID=182773 RepID=A0A343J9W0_9CLOT|nr:hypothetical protein [Clostridium isatidis]ASW42318.1 hypothetical protein BEN51_02085 [Clostridium isatidis]NLZ34779.1 hypothetical protein [Clostridiales bacterium]